HASSGSGGSARFSFSQPANMLGRRSRVATVRVSADRKPDDVIEGTYRIAFAAIDLVVPAQPVPENTDVTTWVHTQPRTAVNIVFTSSYQGTSAQSGQTGRHGWLGLPYRALDPMPDPATVTVVARVHDRPTS